MSKVYEFEATIHPVPDKGGAYVIFPYDIREEFDKGRVKVHARFDGHPYDGSIVNMGVIRMKQAISVTLLAFKRLFEQLLENRLVIEYK